MEIKDAVKEKPKLTKVVFKDGMVYVIPRSADVSKIAKDGIAIDATIVSAFTTGRNTVTGRDQFDNLIDASSGVKYKFEGIDGQSSIPVRNTNIKMEIKSSPYLS